MTSVKPIREKDKINRRTFLTKSVGWSTGLTLLAFPGIITEVLATKGDKSKKEIFKELDEKVDKFMPMYGSCAQASFCALNEQFKLKADNKTIRALMPFTGGIALKGETCGAVSGSLLAIGFVFEPINQKGKKKAGSSMKYGGMFFDRFKKEFGSTRCWGVQKHQYGRYYDTSKPEEMKLFMEVAQKSGKCIEVVKKAVFIAGDIILENS
ncbi:MAG: C_GCAxxG_C_C family protein [Candidatus Aminicenantes bacterium]|nr:C_GCAxxG_C_C family protein [Candidatus Aminicenantes bacterium]